MGYPKRRRERSTTFIPFFLRTFLLYIKTWLLLFHDFIKTISVLKVFNLMHIKRLSIIFPSLVYCLLQATFPTNSLQHNYFLCSSPPWPNLTPSHIIVVFCIFSNIFIDGRRADQKRCLTTVLNLELEMSMYFGHNILCPNILI